MAVEDLVENEPLFRLEGRRSQRLHPSPEGFAFRPVELRKQLLEHEAGEYCLDESEQELGRSWARGVAECIREALDEDLDEVLVGMAMPGLKTRDGRGIAVMRNGPRIPDFADRIEEALGELGVALARPIPPLASDGACCGLGEQLGRCGSFSGAMDAYYVGSGTGLAEALKLGGRLISFEDVGDWMLRAWQLRPLTHSGLGSYEDLLSASGMNRLFHELRGPGPATSGELPEQAARAGDPIAREVLQDAGRALGDLVFDRLRVVRGGKRTRLGFGLTHRDRRGNHPYLGTLLERVVLGQRLASLHEDRSLRPYFRDVFEARLIEHVESCLDEGLRRHLLEDGRLRSGRIVVSRQASAPLLGAAGTAWREASGW